MVMAGVGDRGMGAEATRGIRRRQPSPAGLVLTLDVTLELCRVEVHLPQVARAVPQGLVVEVGRRRIAALPPRRACPSEAGRPRRDELNPAGMLGPESLNGWTMSPVSRWNRLISPQGVFQVPKSDWSRSDAAARACRRCSGVRPWAMC